MAVLKGTPMLLLDILPAGVVRYAAGIPLSDPDVKKHRQYPIRVTK